MDECVKYRLKPFVKNRSISPTFGKNRYFGTVCIRLGPLTYRGLRSLYYSNFKFLHHLNETETVKCRVSSIRPNYSFSMSLHLKLYDIIYPKMGTRNRTYLT